MATAEDDAAEVVVGMTWAKAALVAPTPTNSAASTQLFTRRRRRTP
jgi:hypothetical protein